jgi:hypothetical protein
MGGEPWLYRAPYEPDAKVVVTKYQEELLDECPDWPSVTVGQRKEFCTLTPLSKGELEDYFGTHQPTADLIEDCAEMWESIDRGHGYYIVLYEEGKPSEYCFVGYSFD